MALTFPRSAATIRDAEFAIADRTTYLYEDADFPFALTGVNDNRNIRIATYAYDDAGRGVLTSGASGQNQTTVAYATGVDTMTRTVTNPLGRKTVYTFTSNDPKLLSVDGLASANCPASVASLTYDSPAGFIATTTDQEGRITKYARDAKGRPLSIIQAFGTAAQRQTDITWHPTLDLPLTMARPGLSTAFVYNANGRLISRTETDTTTHTIPYSTAGQTRSWAYTYAAGGLVAAIDGPLSGTGDTLAYTYDSLGYLKTFRNELGQVVTVQTVNGRGQPTKTVDANGLVTDYLYDALGRPASIRADPAGIAAETRMEYDQAGNLTRITQPDGSFLFYGYDTGSRITRIVNARGDNALFTYDAMGNAKTRVLSDGFPRVFFKWTRTFDELGRMIKLAAAGPATWSYGYDKVDNLKTVTDPNLKHADFGYDALDRVVAFTDERLDVTAWAYDDADQSSDRPGEATDDRGVVTDYVRNGWGEAIQESGNDTGATVFERNALGSVTKRTDARGVVSTYVYDVADRIKQIAYPAQTTSAVTYAYDATAGGNYGRGRLTVVAESGGNKAFYTYDILGRVIKEVRATGGQTYATTYEWNAAGNVSAIVYPSGRRIVYDRDANGQIDAMRQTPPGGTPSDLVLSVERTPFGPRSRVTYANNTREVRVYDTDARIANLRLEVISSGSRLIDLPYLYGDNRNLTAIGDETYAYTANGFLATADNAAAWGTEAYTTDGVGNRTQIVRSSPAATDIYALTPGSNRLASITSNGTLSRSFTSDAAGNVASETAGGSTTTYVWNHPGQLSSVRLGSATQATYVYDYLHRLVQRGLPPSSTTLHMVYDLDGDVIAEYTGAGALLREYIWMEDRPVAVIADAGSASPVTWWVQTDHLERPIAMLDGARSFVWRA